MARSTNPKPFTFPLAFREGWRQHVCTGAIVLTLDSPQMQALDANGAGRNVSLPAVGVTHDGMFFVIANSAGAAFNLSIVNAAGGAVATVNQNEMAIVYVSQAGAWTLFGITAYSAT